MNEEKYTKEIAEQEEPKYKKVLRYLWYSIIIIYILYTIYLNL